MVRNHEVRGSIPLFSTKQRTPLAAFFVFGRRMGERTRKGATVAGKYWGLSRRERSKPAERSGAGRQTSAKPADVNPPILHSLCVFPKNKNILILGNSVVRWTYRW